jgi:hypothetical protein
MEMEQNVQILMGRLLARQEDAAVLIAGNQDEMKARQYKVNAEAKTSQNQLKEDIKDPIEVLLEEVRPCGKRTAACQISSVACPEKSKTGPEKTEAETIAFEERSHKIEAKIWE